MKKLRLDELGRMSVDEFRNAEKIPVCLVLDNVRSLHNVGSAFRTADAFAVERMVLAGITGTPPHREINKTALGATESVVWSYEESVAAAVSKIKAEGYEVIIVEQTTQSVPLQKFLTVENKKYCLVFGNEVDGVSEEVLLLADRALEIPQAGTKHSLNVSVCLGVVLWEFYRKIKGL